MKTIRNLVLVRTNGKRKASALLVGFATLALGWGGMSATAVAQTKLDEDDSKSSCSKDRDEGDSKSGCRIEGSWIFALTNTQDPAASFTAVASFTAGGVFLATGSNDRLNPVSPLYGSWKRIGPHRFSTTAYFFAFDPANPNGKAVAMLKSDLVFQLKNPDELVGIVDVSSCDLQGQNCENIPGTHFEISAKRIVPEEKPNDQGGPEGPNL